MILIIDNYDSFVHNLARYVRQLCDEEVIVVRNDDVDSQQVTQLAPSAIIISPGPCRPADSGNTLQIVQECSHIAILGVCLGHQSIIEAFGGQIIQSQKPTHGKPDRIFHDQDHALFEKIPSPFKAGRYHSLVANPESIPDSINVIATNNDGLVMAVAHRNLKAIGVQFHPESVLTEHGYQLLNNFLKIAGVQNVQTATTKETVF